MSGVDRKIFRFGIFEVDPGSGELRKAGSRLRLQGQPFQVLLMLLERPGDVITREEIRAKLWPSDTFVDFDHSLNTIINKIRDVLSDSAANPRFVETLAKRGYRFLVPVDSVAGRSGGGGEGAAVADSFLSSPPSIFRLTQQEELPVVSDGYVCGLFLLIQMMYLAFYIVVLARLPAVQDLLERMFSGNPGLTVAVILLASIGIPIRLLSVLRRVVLDYRSEAQVSQAFSRIVRSRRDMGALAVLANPANRSRLGLGHYRSSGLRPIWAADARFDAQKEQSGPKSGEISHVAFSLPRPLGVVYLGRALSTT
jgi:DNA-binding winged helix-turn-helix (wHTH) protein